MLAAAFALYVVAGPGLWLLLLIGMGMGNRRMGKLRKGEPWPLPDDLPGVCVVVPAKDEEEHVADTLRSVLAMDYPALRVIAVNDRSADRTGEVIDALAAEDDRLTAHHVRELPEGWLGKCHALHEATAGGEGPTDEWLLFIDSDVTVAPAAAREAVGMAVERGYDAVSLVSRLRPRTFLERWLVPVLAATWATLFTISRTNEPRSRVAAANGQFFLVRRSAYVDVGGHGSVRDRLTEDVALMRRLKQAGHSVRLLHGGHLVATQMHATWRQVTHGWARILTGTADGRATPAALALLIAAGGLLPVVLWRIDVGWAVAAAAHAALVVAWLVFVYRGTRISPLLAALWPVTLAASAVVFAYAAWRGLRGTVDWRGSAVTQRGG